MTERKDLEHFHVDAADLDTADILAGVDRREFMMRSAVIGATAVIAGCSKTELDARNPPAAGALC
jgi:hypothetical protein